MKVETNVFGFVMEIINNQKKFIADHVKYDLPINYEISIDECKMRVSHVGSLEYHFEQDFLWEAMIVIADWTNNEMRCGCTFTMGW